MRALLSTIGSRGDVQPLVALALQLTALGHEVHLCVPPDFREWIEGLGLTVTTIGPELRPLTAGRTPSLPMTFTPERARQMADESVSGQFATIGRIASGVDIIVGATALQIAARSVAESLGVPYVFVAYCPIVLPSPHHAPPPLRARGETAQIGDNRTLWARDAARFTETFGTALDSGRSLLGLAPAGDVRAHVFTDQPWLAADPTLAPWPGSDEATVFQTGAWLVHDERPLAPDVEAFLAAGEPPVYFGFGSVRAPIEVARSMIESARAVGRRAILSRGWADLAVDDGAADCLSIGEVNQRALFSRVAAIVHHGGAGTTHAAALGGAPQVVIPQMYDQRYWAARVRELRIGVTLADDALSTETLTPALEQTLDTTVVARARALAARVRTDGALVAAQRLIALVGA